MHRRHPIARSARFSAREAIALVIVATLEH
jgi:hypothetical protein